MKYQRKASGPHRHRSRQALARDIAASILAAQQRGEQRPITTYMQHEETIRLDVHFVNPMPVDSGLDKV